MRDMPIAEHPDQRRLEFMSEPNSTQPQRDGPQPSAASAGSVREQELAALVDECALIIEMWTPRSPRQMAWKERWMNDAKRLVPGCTGLW